MRRALPEDVEELAELEEALFPENCFNAYTLKRELRFSQVWVEESDDHVVAYLIARVDRDIVDVMRVGVREEHRRMGIAYRLMSKALSLAPRAVLMVLKTNKPALQLYRDIGFNIVGELHQSWMMIREPSAEAGRVART